MKQRIRCDGVARFARRQLGRALTCSRDSSVGSASIQAGNQHHASKDNPQYEIRSDKADYIAAYQGSALDHA